MKMETTVIVRGWNLDYLWSKFTDPTFWSDPAVVVLIGLVAIFVVALMIVLPNKPINQLTDQDNLGWVLMVFVVGIFVFFIWPILVQVGWRFIVPFIVMVLLFIAALFFMGRKKSTTVTTTSSTTTSPTP
jgi:hypothetical protein